MRRRTPDTSATSAVRRDVRSVISPTVAVVVGLLGFEAAIVLAAQMTHALRIRSFVAVTLTALGICSALAVASCGVRPWRRVRLGRLQIGELALWAGVAVIFAFALSRAAGGSGWSPPTHTVDVAHHGSIVAWIGEHQDFPRAYTAQLDSFSFYPNATHTVTALFGWITRCSPLTAMWWMALSWIVMIWLLSGVLVHRITRSWAAALIPTVFAIAVWRYTIGMITYDFFFSQLGGLAFAIAGVTCVVCGCCADLASRLWLPITVLLGVVAALAYPQHLAILPAALAGVGIVSWGRNGRRFTRRTVVTLSGVIGVLAIAAITIGRQIDIGRRTLTGEGEGTVTAPSLRTFGGVIPCLFVGNGLAELLTSRLRRRGDRASAALVGAAAGPLLLSGVFWLLRRGIPVKVAIYNYRLHKNFYSAIPFLLVVAAVGVGWALRSESDLGTTRPRATLLFVASVVAGVALLLGPTLRYSSRHPILTRDGYALGRWVGEHYDATDVGIVAPGIEPYFLWRLALRRPIDRNRMPEVKPTYRWVTWPKKEPERYLLVDGPSADEYAELAGVRVVRRLGSAALLERGLP